MILWDATLKQYIRSKCTFWILEGTYYPPCTNWPYREILLQLFFPRAQWVQHLSRQKWGCFCILPSPVTCRVLGWWSRSCCLCHCLRWPGIISFYLLDLSLSIFIRVFVVIISTLRSSILHKTSGSPELDSFFMF